MKLVEDVEHSWSAFANYAASKLPAGSMVSFHATARINQGSLVEEHSIVACDGVDMGDSDSDSSTAGTFGQTSSEAACAACISPFKKAEMKSSYYGLVSAVLDDNEAILLEEVNKRARRHLQTLNKASPASIHVGISNWLQKLDDDSLRFRVAQLAAIVFKDNDHYSSLQQCENCSDQSDSCSSGCPKSFWKAILTSIHQEEASESSPLKGGSNKKGERYQSYAEVNSDDDETMSTGQWSVDEHNLLMSLDRRQSDDDSRSEGSSRYTAYGKPSRLTEGTSHSPAEQYRLNTLLKAKMYNSESTMDIFKTKAARRNRVNSSMESEGPLPLSPTVELQAKNAEAEDGFKLEVSASLAPKDDDEIKELISSDSLQVTIERTETFQKYGGRPFDEFYWSQEFAKLHSQRPKTRDELVKKYLALSSLANDFIRTSEMYGRVISSERDLDVRQKAIKPANLGGVAGGEKFAAGGIIFKFALDAEGLYGSDDLAAKGARHDLKGLNAIHKVVFSRHLDLRLPLMSVLDFKGVTIVAVATLPVHKRTIIYGSSDGGKTVHASDSDVNKMMSKIGKALNLKDHIVGGKTMAMCGDLEVHRAGDGYCYALDFARVFPPQPPSRRRVALQTGSLSSIFHNLLRPELVRSGKPLCSDAFSLWDDSPERIANCRDAKEAYRSMVLDKVPKVADNLDGELEVADWACRVEISDRMHKNGVNVRHLGLVYMCLRTPYWKSIVLTELVSRSIKTLFRMMLRQASAEFHGIPSTEPYRALVLELMNITFRSGGRSEEGNDIWTRIHAIAYTKFSGSLPEDFRHHVHWGRLFERLCVMLYLDIPESVWEPISQQRSPFISSTFLTQNDLREIGFRTNNMDIVQAGMAIQAYLKSAQASGKARIALLTEATKLFVQTTMIDPDKLHYEAFANIELAIELFKEGKRQRDINLSIGSISREEMDPSVITNQIRAFSMFTKAEKLFKESFGDQPLPEDRCFTPSEEDNVLRIWEEYGIRVMEYACSRPTMSQHGTIMGGVQASADVRFLYLAKVIFSKVAMASRDRQRALARVSKIWNQKMATNPRVQQHPCLIMHSGHSDLVTCIKATKMNSLEIHLADHLFSCGTDGRVVSWCSRDQSILSVTRAVRPDGARDPLFSLTIEYPYVICGSLSGFLYIFRLGKDGDSQYQMTLDRRIVAHDDCIRSLVVFSRKKLLISGGHDCKIKLWNMETWEVVKTLEHHTDWVLNCYMNTSRDPKHLYTASTDCTVQMVDMEDDFKVVRVLQHSYPVYASTICEDGCCLFTTAGKDIWRWDLGSKKREDVLVGHTDDVTSLICFHGVLYSGSRDATFNLWTQSSCKKVDTLHFKHYSSSACAVDGGSLYGAGPRGLLYVWDLQTLVFTGLFNTPERVAIEAKKKGKRVHYHNFTETESFACFIHSEGFEVFSFRSMQHWGSMKFDHLTVATHVRDDLVIVHFFNYAELLLVDLHDLQILKRVDTLPYHKGVFAHHTLSTAICNGTFFVGGRANDQAYFYGYDVNTFDLVLRLEPPKDFPSRIRAVTSTQEHVYYGGGSSVAQVDPIEMKIIRIINIGSNVFVLRAHCVSGFKTRVYVGTDQTLAELDTEHGTILPYESKKADTIHDIGVCEQFVYTTSDLRTVRRWCPRMRKCVDVIPEVTVGSVISGSFNRSRRSLVISKGSYPGKYANMMFNSSSAGRFYFNRSRFWYGSQAEVMAAPSQENSAKTFHDNYYNNISEQLNENIGKRQTLLIGTFQAIHQEFSSKDYDFLQKVLSYYFELYHKRLWRHTIGLEYFDGRRVDVRLHLVFRPTTREKVFIIAIRGDENCGCGDGVFSDCNNLDDMHHLKDPSRVMFDVPLSAVKKATFGYMTNSGERLHSNEKGGAGRLALLYEVDNAALPLQPCPPDTPFGTGAIAASPETKLDVSATIPEDDETQYEAINVSLGDNYALLQFWMGIGNNIETISEGSQNWESQQLDVGSDAVSRLTALDMENDE